MAIHLAGVRRVHSAQSIDRAFSVTSSTRPPWFPSISAVPAPARAVSPRGVKAHVLAVASLAAALGSGACDARHESAPSRPASTEARPAPRPEPGAAREPTTLLSLPTSAYQASLAVDDDGAHLLTSHAAYRLAPGQPPDALKVELGFGATTTRHGLVFWSGGVVHEASKQSGESRVWGALASRPQFFVSAGDDIAWIERSEDHRFAIGSFAARRAFVLYTSSGTIDAAAMLNDWIFFVERPSADQWRIGGVRTKGGTAVFTPARQGRSPAMLVAHDDIYYYDGNGRDVRRLSPDLRREETLVTDFICSPLAVAERVYCANVEGIFELVPQGRPRPLVKLGHRGTVTDLAANAHQLFWMGDAGADRLIVQTIPLPSE